MSALSNEEVKRLRAELEQISNDAELHTELARALAGYVARNFDAVELLRYVPEPQRDWEFLASAVNYMVLRGAQHEYARIYNNPGARDARNEIGPAFVDFCDQNSGPIVNAMRSHEYRPDAINLCGSLVPGLMIVARQTARPLALVEIGAGAGFRLLFDRFRYNFVGGPIIGTSASGVRLQAEIRGPRPSLSGAFPFVDHRVGIDSEPIDVGDDDAVKWMHASVEIGDSVKDERVSSLIALGRGEWPDVRRGAASGLLPHIVHSLEESCEVVLFSAGAMSRMEDIERERLVDAITTIAIRRRLWFLATEPPGIIPTTAVETGEENQNSEPGGHAQCDYGVMSLQEIDDMGIKITVLANVDRYGRWIDWKDNSALSQ